MTDADVLRGQLAEMTSERNGWGDTAQENLSQRDEAREIARRLADGFRCSHLGMNPQPMLDALAAFDTANEDWEKPA